ncbi:hypothetical protein D8B26_006053 [Coccidioides posadasii str. Silveira]|uniref:Ankyrin repeat protein n=2 Tax=Coccidioides posadasii TaxID=199306 RepID=E9DBU8_COCPS|nr:Ankyrin repeat domain containing protein [Coccidioides posadasii C735 delta SOWgp]EER27835.1 Ankyrin repeat domain containing protein [Coccidioides posadasii C735 delta SOWgp]EFW16250.1 ankyrin repeat protein [Coccidioides posadasii str. Silveira]QVM11405.1 hypothetical protein D8B26_006053 [Coccidioides posadasii str. Silveira]|eukprot:XP_003069980.1 Ankyrin repeat domain containing protein [Coccidioides posadasii C735 delta SOWgp]
MSLLDLPGELIFQIAGYLEESDLNSFLRTNRTAAEMLTPTLYDKGFATEHGFRSEVLGHLLNADEVAVAMKFYGILLAKMTYPPAVDSEQRGAQAKPFCISRFRALPCLRAWKSLYITDYFANHLSKFKINSSANDQRLTLLHIVSESGNDTIARTLIDSGANVNATDYYGRRPIHLACCEGKTEVIKLLLDSGADIMAQDNFGLTPFAYAARVDNAAALELVIGRVRLVNGDLFLPKTDGATPLHTAATDGRVDKVRYLIELGANSCAVDRLGRPPLEQAIARGKLGAVKILVEDMMRLGWDVSSLYAGRTALHDAVWVKSRDMIGFLVQKGANANKRDGLGQSAINLAEELGVPLKWFRCPGT